MSQSNNPYAPAPGFEPSPGPIGTGPGDRSMFGQILVIGILQIVVGALELLMGALLIVYTFFIPYLLNEQAKQGGGNPPPPAEMLTVMAVIFGVLAALTLFSATFRIYTGIRSFWFRGRTALITSLFFGIVTACTCYCGVTSVPLAIYGAIVMFSPAAKQAFLMRKQGMEPQQIRAMFGG